MFEQGLISSFEDTLVLSRKDYKRIIYLALIIYNIAVVIIIFQIPIHLDFFVLLLHWEKWALVSWHGVGHVTFLLLILFWACLLVLSPVLYVLYVIQERRLRKIFQQLKEVTKQPDKADCL